MALKDELKVQLKKFFSEVWSERDGNVVPSDESLKLTNDSIKLDATVLYSDLGDSTNMVDSFGYEFSAEIYKSFLYTAGRIIRAEGGTITAYDGDRIMAVFIGDSKNTSSVRAAMKLRWAESNLINPAKQEQYPKTTFSCTHATGIDTSVLHVAKTGVRGANDLVWVGRAANHAAKLSSLPAGFTWISSSVYGQLADVAKFSNGTNMWTTMKWTEWDGRTIYRSSYYWELV